MIFVRLPSVSNAIVSFDTAELLSWSVAVSVILKFLPDAGAEESDSPVSFMISGFVFDHCCEIVKPVDSSGSKGVGQINNIEEAKSRGAIPIVISNKDVNYDYKVVVDKVNPFMQPLLIIPVLQLIAYETAKLRGCDIDKPKNLAKSVTVE